MAGWCCGRSDRLPSAVQVPFFLTSPEEEQSMAGKKEPKAAKPGKPAPGEVVLLSGGNPQIAKGYGDEPVQAYIAAMPGWKSEIGKRLDTIIGRAVPGVK